MKRTALKLFRIQHGLTQDEMAVKIGFSRNQYQRVECGEQNVSLKFLVALSNAFGMRLEDAKELTKCDKEKREENDRKTRGE